MLFFLQQVRRNNMMARLLGRELRSRFERTYQFEVNGAVETVIVPPWHQRVLPSPAALKASVVPLLD